MKKIWNISFIYFWLAMAGGVFYREFTKFNDYTGVTALGYIHVHLIVLGMLLFLVIALFCKTTGLLDNKLFKKFLVLYNIALPFMMIMMLVRGITQVLGTNLSTSMNGMISGLAGVSHVLMLVSLLLLLLGLKKELLPVKKE